MDDLKAYSSTLMSRPTLQAQDCLVHFLQLRSTLNALYESHTTLSETSVVGCAFQVPSSSNLQLIHVALESWCDFGHLSAPTTFLKDHCLSAFE